jgi:hypothetical protein
MQTLFRKYRVLFLRAAALLSVLGCIVLLCWLAPVVVRQEPAKDNMVPGEQSARASGNQPNGSADSDSLAHRLESDVGSQVISGIDKQDAGKPDSRRDANLAADASGEQNSADALAGKCPVRFPQDCQPIGHSMGANTERWQAKSSISCRSAAYELLLGLRSDGFTLGKADFLGLSDESWGCAVTSAAGEVFVISMIPESLGSVRNESNRLVITVVRIFNPKYDNGQEAGQGTGTRSKP